MNQIILGGGCFWCLEASFQPLKGIQRVTSGYAGGTKATATYKQVCSGNSGHTEVVLIAYDSEEISLETILEVFWQIHDPTTLNRQGNDKGPQYRSVIYYADEKEKGIIQQSIEESAKPLWGDGIVTAVEPVVPFYPAEIEHNDYYRRIGDRNPYCTWVVRPKVDKVREKFGHLLDSGQSFA